ncbi:MAG: PepSY domain-containing protein [Beijerinckiaceae bacterium]
MLKAYALRFHRWITLIFAIPLFVVIATGLVLSFEPLAQRMTLDKPLTKDVMLGYLNQHDPQGKATGISIRNYEQTLTIAGAGPDGEVELDLRTGEVLEDDNSWSMSEVFRVSRRMHEHLLLEMEWLVIASTIAMLAISALGLLMGLPRLRNTLGGWHNVSAWTILPLVVLVPLTGLAISFGISFTTPPSGPRAERVAIKDAVVLVGEKHDLANMTALRTRGGRLVARVYEGNVLTGFAVTKDGLATTQTNWPRALHEGNWHAVWGSVFNIIASIVFLGLWLTGLIIWARRQLRTRKPRETARAVQPAE